MWHMAPHTADAGDFGKRTCSIRFSIKKPSVYKTPSLSLLDLFKIAAFS